MVGTVELPSAKVLQTIMDLCRNNSDAANYFISRFEELLTHAKNVPPDVVATIRNWGKAADAQNVNTQPLWDGKKVPTRSQNMNEFIVKEHVAEMLATNVEFNISINEATEILRGYRVDGNVLEDGSAELQKWDDIFKTWMESCDYEFVNGKVYDINGHEISQAEFQNAVTDQNRGYKKYLENKIPNAQTEVIIVGEQAPVPEENQAIRGSNN